MASFGDRENSGRAKTSIAKFDPNLHKSRCIYVFNGGLSVTVDNSNSLFIQDSDLGCFNEQEGGKKPYLLLHNSTDSNFCLVQFLSSPFPFVFSLI